MTHQLQLGVRCSGCGVEGMVHQKGTCPDPDPPAQRHSRTSRQAAKEIKPYVKSIRQRVHEVIIRQGPISDQAIAEALGLAENTVRPRRVELVAEGWARAAPETVLTRSRRQATAWIPSEP